MVYENTHLWAAEKIRNRIPNQDIKDIIGTHIDAYHFGAVFPDVLYYSRNPEISDSAHYLHGDAGAPSNAVIFDILDQISGTSDQKNLAFTWGILTHCAMDIVFHPVVFYFSGYDPEAGQKEQERSGYLHLHYETIIDRHFNNGIFFENLVRPSVLDDLIAPSIPNISRQNIINCLQTQLFYFRIIHSRLYYLVYKLLAAMGLVDKKLVAGFYANISVDTRSLPEVLHYRDIITGDNRETTLDGLMGKGIIMATDMIEAAYEYYAGNIRKETCQVTIAGNNLVTGRLDKSRADIRFSVKS
jgi:hypothetical protein